LTKRALISVFDKTGIVDLARELVELGFELLSTGGTKRALEEANLPVTGISEVTGFPEILDGRVKTLHPKIHGGLLARLDQEDHQRQLKEHGIVPIQILCVNLYPFQETIAREDASLEEAIENIDIGGPAMLRAAAKNHEQVTVLIDPADYPEVLSQLREQGEVNLETKRRLAAKAFRHTAAYDALIADYLTGLTGEAFPEKLTVTYELQQPLRYGENPHQRAAFYRKPLGLKSSLPYARQLHGKELSYNNINDAEAALQMVREFAEPAAVAVKHTNPCGVGTGATLAEAFTKAYASDPVSIFGGIVALNREVDGETAEQLQEIFLEIVIAPSFSPEALELLTKKKNLRLLALPLDAPPAGERKLTSIWGGLLVQDYDWFTLEQARLIVPTKREPTAEEWAALKFGWRVVKHVKSNAIVVCTKDRTLGIGAGQMNRVGAAQIALQQAGEKAKGAVLASDAFFPMPDTVEAAAKAGITAIIQPGGSIRDADSIVLADEHQIAMVFTGIRHFKH
jgi:phosphoribosylaminoimidazolecarboxamide formyltransferase/IMP cyclohydrolase